MFGMTLYVLARVFNKDNWRIQEIGRGFQRPRTIARIMAKEIADLRIVSKKE